MWRWLQRWWRPRREIRVLVYTRRVCPLCDEAIAFLDRQRARLPFRLVLIDVDSSPLLVERFGNWVPVVEVNGKVRFRGHVNPVLWNRLVTALER